MEGRVVSDKTNKTVTVLVERRIMDPLYKKFIRRSQKYAAHDEANAFRTGDFVSIEECPPISKSKRFKVISPAPEKAREDKPVVKALAIRAEAEQNKPEPKKATAKPAGTSKAAAKPGKKAEPEQVAKPAPAKAEKPKAAAPAKGKEAKAEPAAKPISKAAPKAAKKEEAKVAKKPALKKKDD
jgi:small subunit ribosomal protein S17